MTKDHDGYINLKELKEKFEQLKPIEDEDVDGHIWYGKIEKILDELKEE